MLDSFFKFLGSFFGNSNADDPIERYTCKSDEALSAKSAINTDEGNCSIQSSKNEEDISELTETIIDTDYIHNLRVGRSWVLPKMVDMCFDSKGIFSETSYYASFEDMLYSEDCWRILIRTYSSLSRLYEKNKEEYLLRSKWWTKEVAIAMAKNDLNLMLKYIDESSCPFEHRNNCKGGAYVYLGRLRNTPKKNRYFFLQAPPAGFVNGLKDSNDTIEDLKKDFLSRIQAIEFANSPDEVYKALKAYDAKRCFFYDWGDVLPEEFINAYAGDGAYYSMMTMVKFLNICIPGMNREESLAAINSKFNEVGNDGRALFRYCADNFFDTSKGGMFNYQKYRKHQY